MNANISAILDKCNEGESDCDENIKLITIILEKYVFKGNENLLEEFGLDSDGYSLSKSDYEELIDILMGKLQTNINNRNLAYLYAWPLTKTHDELIYERLFRILEKKYMEDDLLTKQILLGIGSEYFINQKKLVENIKENIGNEEIKEIVDGIQKINEKRGWRK